MKTFDRNHPLPARQGEILITAIDTVPDGVPEDTSPRARVIGESNSGHDHVLQGKVRVFRKTEQSVENSCVFWSSVEEDAVLGHEHSGGDAHESIELPKGAYKFTIHREVTPEGIARAID